MNINQTTLVGRITHTPILKVLPLGSKVTSVTIVTNRTWKDKDGQKQESAEFTDCVAFGRTAEVMAEYLEGGQEIAVIGRLQTRSWQKEGEETKRYKTEVVIETMQMGAKSQARAERKAAEGEHNQSPKQEDIDTIEYPEEDINPEDIPF